MTPELIRYLAAEGYTVLIAENGPKNYDYIFFPLKTDVDEVIEKTDLYRNYVVLFVAEALNMPSELFLNHEVIL